MSKGEKVEKEDPIRIHKEGTTLADVGKFEEASKKYLRAYELYKEAKNFFDASYALYKAAECNFQLKDYNQAKEHFLNSADLAFEKGYNRFGVSALEYALDCYKNMGKEEQAEELEQKIKDAKTKLQNF